MTVLRVSNWGSHFENNRTRELKSLEWVPLPNSQDGDGYTELVEVREGERPDDGALRFAAWCALVQIASKCRPRGTLLRRGAMPPQQGAAVPHDAARGFRAHDAESLSRISRLPRGCFTLCIDRALEIGWLERVDLTDQELTALSQDDAGKPHPPAEKRLRNGMEGNGIINTPQPPNGGQRRREERVRGRMPKAQRIANRIAEVAL